MKSLIIRGKNVLIVLILLLCWFVSNHSQQVYAQEKIVSCNESWDNDYAVNQSFWQLNPTDDEVVCALYGEGPGDTTAYTQNWTGWNTAQCDLENMSVLYTETLGTTNIVSNTIYVLTGVASVVDETINMESCSAIVSRDASGTIFSSVAQLPRGMFSAKGRRYVILDNLHIDGVSGTGNNNHNKNSYGIIFQNSFDNTFHNIRIYNNIVGIHLYRASSYTTLSDISSHDNKYGISISQNSNNNFLLENHIYNNIYGFFGLDIQSNSVHNSQFYNNTLVGIALLSAKNNTFNNIQSYNNGRGIYLENSSNNVFHTMQTYNNQWGMYFYNNAGGNSLSSVHIYNNTYYGIQFSASSTGNTYYNSNMIFDNELGGIYGSVGVEDTNNLIQGMSDTYPSLGRNTGIIITTGTMSRDMLTNPMSSDGQYLLPRDISRDSMRGQKSNYLTKTTEKYSYGSGILLQKQPVGYIGSTIVPLLSCTSDAYIGSNLSKVGGTATIQGASVMVESQSQEISHYSLFGNITTPILGSSLGNDSNIAYENGIPNPRVIAQLYTPGGYFATHFEASTGVFGNTTCASRWDNDNFLNETFRANTPNDGQIICALYGAGPGDTTAYTEYRSGWDTTQCNLQNMQVVHTSSLGVTNLSSNTIYVLDGDQSISTGSMYMNTCSAIVSKNTSGTTFYTQQYVPWNGTLRLENNQYNILDNLTFQGTGGGPVPAHKANNYGIRLINSKNNTLYNVVTHDNMEYGIRLSSSDNNVLHTVSSYKAIVGVMIQTSSFNYAKNITVRNNSEGCIIHAGTYNTIENILSYNNSQAGTQIRHYLSTNNTITNIHSYNNQYGVGLSPHLGGEGGPSYNTINNAQIHNNMFGIYINTGYANVINNASVYNNNIGTAYCAIYLQNASENIMNNVEIYNNTCGIYLENNSQDNKYYGDLSIYHNLGGDILYNIDGIYTGQAIDIPGLDWEDGQLISTGILSWDIISNPLNTNGDYLLPRTGSWSSIIGKKNRYTNTITDAYSYGINIPSQIQPVSYLGQSLSTVGDFVTDEYIGSTTKKIPSSIEEALPTITNLVSPYTITPISDIATHYTIFGDIQGVPFTYTIGNNISFSLIPGDGEKKIITQIFGPFATHFQKTILLDQIPPTATISYSPQAENWAGGPVTATIHSFSEEIVGLNESDHVFVTDGTFTFTFQDLAGNQGEVTAVVDWIGGKSLSVGDGKAIERGNDTHLQDKEKEDKEDKEDKEEGIEEEKKNDEESHLRNERSQIQQDGILTKIQGLIEGINLRR